MKVKKYYNNAIEKLETKCRTPNVKKSIVNKNFQRIHHNKEETLNFKQQTQI